MQLSLLKSTIRSFQATDIHSLARHIGTLSVARNMAAVPHPYSLQDAQEWIATAFAAAPATHFAIVLNEQVGGGIGVEVGDVRKSLVCSHSGEIGYWLGEDFWGQGIMSEAVIAVTEWAFTTLGLVRLHAAVFARNPASARVLAKAGYEFEGRQRARYFRDGEYIDGLMFAKVRDLTKIT